MPTPAPPAFAPHPNATLTGRKLNKWFRKPTEFHVLKDIDVEVMRGEFVAVMGKSGSGKSTLLYLLSTLDTDYTGDIWLGPTHVTRLPERQLAHVRNASIGFVFQFHFLLPEFTVLQNVMLPAIKLGQYSRAEIEHRAMEKLRLLDVAEQALKPASRLSGGQQQRVSIARALINDPAIVMGDEPTGNLDSRNMLNVLGILRDLARQYGQTIIAVTHDNDFADAADRIIWLRDGATAPAPARHDRV
jgi:lipoprotein-releasing system ATP-binding protein